MHTFSFLLSRIFLVSVLKEVKQATNDNSTFNFEPHFLIHGHKIQQKQCLTLVIIHTATLPKQHQQQIRIQNTKNDS